MKKLLAMTILLTLVVSTNVLAKKTGKNYENVISIGADSASEKINLKLLDQTDSGTSEINNSKVLNFKAESIRDTHRKSFHSLRNVEEVTSDEMMIIK